MSRPYPPHIKWATFASSDAPALVTVGQCPQEQPKQCSLEGLELAAAQGAPGGRSFPETDPHGDLIGAVKGRSPMAPGVDKGFINWRIDGAEHVLAARLDLYYLASGAVTPLWTKALAWDPGQCPTFGSTPFSGRLTPDEQERVSPGAKSVDVIYQRSSDFPTDHLNVQQAPYKLEMTLLSVSGATVRTRRRYVYIDVVVASVALRLGPPEWIPELTGARDRGFNRRNQFVQSQIAAQFGGALHKDLLILLDGNFFSSKSDDMTNRASGDGWAARWRDGPYIPLVATAQVIDRSYKAVTAPQALGGARFLWDWYGRPRTDVSGLGPKTIPAMNRAYDLERLINESIIPKAGSNTIEKNGGRLGMTTPLFKHGDDGHARHVRDGRGHFPFAMEPCGARRAVFSHPRSDGLCPGQTGVLFTPSLISEDQYRIHVYFAYGGRAEWDQPDDAPTAAKHLIPYQVPFAESGWMTVRRQVRLARHWAPQGTLKSVGFTWDKLVKEFDGAGIVFDVSRAQKPTVLDRKRFARYLVEEIAKLPVAQRDLFAPENEQLKEGYAVKLRTYSELVQQAGAIYQSRLKTHANLPSGATTLTAYIDAHCSLVGDSTAMPGVIDAWKHSNAVDRLEAITRQDVFHAARALKSDAAAGASLVELVHGWADESQHLTHCKQATRQMLFAVCGRMAQETASDEPGLHFFQFDFESSLETFSASGWGFKTPSNLTKCPECDANLAKKDQEERKCASCGAPIHDDASLMTLVPLSLVRPIGVLDLTWNLRGVVSLATNPQDPRVATLAQRLTLQSMPGVRAEVLVAHEMGHQLFLPHAPSGFNRADVVVPRDISFVQGQMLTKFLEVLDATPALLQQVQEETDPAGANEDLHDRDHGACMMGYNFAALTQMAFCCKCILRLRGWPRNGIEGLR